MAPYEDINDDDRLRADPLLASPIRWARTGARAKDKGNALSGKSTLIIASSVQRAILCMGKTPYSIRC